MDLKSHDTRPGTEGVHTIQVLVRGLEVLSAVLDADDPLTLTEIAKQTDLHIATASRLLATLANTGFVTSEPLDRRYYPGPNLAKWLRISKSESLLSQRGLPMLTALRDLSGESVGLYGLAWPDRISTQRLSSNQPIQHHQEVGGIGPLTRGATGRSFLMGAPAEYVMQTLAERPLKQYTENSITGEAAFLEQLSIDHRNGFSIACEETTYGMNGLTAPIIREGSDLPVAVVNVSGPTFRWTRERITQFAPTLLKQTTQLADLLAPGSQE